MLDGVGVLAAVAFGGYFFGSFPTAYLLVKRFGHKNLLEWGTGNVGTANVHRATNSKGLTLATLAGDMLKSALAILVGVYIARTAGMQGDIGAGVGGVAAIMGHNYSVFLKFKGGKGLVCTSVLGFYFAPAMVGLWVLMFLVTVAFTRLMVVGQMAAMAAMPVIAYFAFPQAAVPSYFATALVLIRHAPRIKNVLDGTEPKMYYKIRESPDD